MSPDEMGAFSPISETAARIGDNVAQFLAGQLKKGLIPKGFLPIQSGVGDTANAVLKSMGDCPDIPQFEMYTEVIQDAVIALMRSRQSPVRQRLLPDGQQPGPARHLRRP